jgi:predicted Rossmann fold nucleotide-binding protein DprA/Smf involved in DNA uptake
MTVNITTIASESSDFPSTLKNGLVRPVPTCIWAIGNLGILGRRLLGFFCSTQCSGDVILRTYDLAQALRGAGIPIIGGFHSPMEKECLDLLLRGQQPIVICPARSLQGMRIPSAWRLALDQQRLLIVSPFEKKHRRATAVLAEQRNRVVAALAAEVFIAHAGQRTKTERLCAELLDGGTRVHVLDLPDNAHLIEGGAQPIQLDYIRTMATRFKDGVT